MLLLAILTPHLAHVKLPTMFDINWAVCWNIV